MRVLLVAGMYPPHMCGVGDYTARLAERLATTPELHVGLLTANEIQPLSPEVQSIRFTGGWNWSAVPRIWRAVQSFNPDVVHFQYPSLGYKRRLSPILFACLVRMSGIPLVVTLHEAMRWLSTPWFLALVWSARSVIYVRPNYFELLPNAHAWYLRRRPHQLIANASAIPTSRLNDVGRQNLRDQYAEGKSRLICFFGFIFPNKGIELLLDVVNAQTDRLILIGANPDAAYNDFIRQEFEKRALSGTVSLTGALPAEQVADLLACADVVVLPLPAGAGSWNTSVNSALAQGTAVITTTLDHPRHDLKRNLFLVRPGDAQGICELMERYAGRKVEPESTQTQWKRIVEQHVQVYEAVG